MSDNGGEKTIELFIGCRNLVHVSEKAYDAFVVLMIKRTPNGKYEELQRSETLCHNAHPQFCTSFEVDYDASSEYSPMLRFDVYERMTVDTERLRDHNHRGTTCASIETLMTARRNQLELLLHHPWDPRNAGTISIAAEEVDKQHPENASVVQVDVSVSVLRRRDWNKTLVSQRYELCRAHQHDDETGRTVWLPVYRSDRVAKQRDSATLIEFSTASITYRHLCNADEERDMRLAFYGVPQAIVKHPSVVVGNIAASHNKKGESLLAYADFTLRFICEIDPTEEVLGLEKDGIVDNIGNVSILRAEPTDFGSHFSLQVNFDHTDKYTSASSDEKKGSTKRLTMLKMVHRKSLAAGGRSDAKVMSSLSIVKGLFSENSLESDNSDAKDDDDL